MPTKSKAAAKTDLHRKHSAIVVDGVERAASRAMLHAVGFKREDFQKSQIGIASLWSMVTPCNMHLDRLAKESAKGVDAAGGKSIIFNTITISDGISMGTEGMKYSLVSREVIADSIETVVGCEGMDVFMMVGWSQNTERWLLEKVVLGVDVLRSNVIPWNRKCFFARMGHAWRSPCQ